MTKAESHAHPSNAKRKPATHPANAFTPHSTLPTRRAFFRRKKELETIAKFLQPGHVGWGVVLDGPGGIGKTALALEASHLAPAEHYPLKLFVSAKSRRLDPDGERPLQRQPSGGVLRATDGNWFGLGP